MSKLKEQMIDAQLETLMNGCHPKNTAGREMYAKMIRDRQLSRTLPFDPRNEVSADAVYISGRIVTSQVAKPSAGNRTRGLELEEQHGRATIGLQDGRTNDHFSQW